MFTFARLRRGVGRSVLAVGLLAAAGCSGPAGTGSARPSVVTGFYATEYLAARIGGDRVDVTSLTPPGAEPHDLELTSRQVVQIAKSDLTITLPGFQPAVDDGIRAAQADHVLDITAAAGLEPLTGHEHVHAEDAPVDDGHEAEHEAEAEHEDGSEHDHESEHEGESAHDHEALAHDPHFWLNPELMSRVALTIAGELSRIDPAGAQAYQGRSRALQDQLATLTTDYTTRLAHCADNELVVGHAAYGHLAALAGFEQHALALNPDADPSAAKLAEITAFVREHGTRVIYTEPLVSPKIVEVVAAETGARTAVLDPIEGLTETSAARDYLGLMRANLTTLITGQECTP